MESGKVFDTAAQSRQATCELKQSGDFLIVFFLPMLYLHAAILSCADQEVTSLELNMLQQAKDIGPAISHMKPLRIG
jgi:hypothetical protein